jgi:hypothetical protein
VLSWALLALPGYAEATMNRYVEKVAGLTRSRSTPMLLMAAVCLVLMVVALIRGDFWLGVCLALSAFGVYVTSPLLGEQNMK